MSRVKNISDNIYFNAIKYNTSNNLELAEYTSFRRQTIVDDPLLYYLIIEKFYISSENIFYFVYKDNMSVTINDSQVFLQFFSVTPLQYDPYQAIKFMDQFLIMVNNALAQAHINAGVAGLSPEMVYDGVVCTMVFDAQYIADGTTVYFNDALHLKFQNMMHILIGRGMPLGKDVEFRPFPSLINQYLTFPPNLAQTSKFSGIPVVTLVAQGPGLPLLSEVERLIVYSTLLPTQKEYITLPDDSASDASASILFEVNKFNEYNKETFYIKLGDQKLIDLKSNDQITDIDYKVMVETRDGTLYKIYLVPNSTMGLSLSFKKKTLFNNQYSFDQRV